MLSLLAQTNPNTVAPASTTKLGGFTPPTQAYSANSASGLTALQNLETLLSTIIGFITILAGLFFIFNFVTAALNWVSVGESSKVEKARDKMTQSAIGLVVVIISYALIGVIGSVIGINILTPAALIRTIIPTVPTP
jgi:hypothetical protein